MAVGEDVVQRFLSSSAQKVVEINFNLATKDYWEKFEDASRKAKSSVNYLLQDASD